MIFLVLGVVILLLAQFILVPVLQNVRKSNRKVLSLFGLVVILVYYDQIPLAEIQILASKCDNYLLNCMEDNKETIH